MPQLTFALLSPGPAARINRRRQYARQSRFHIVLQGAAAALRRRSTLAGGSRPGAPPPSFGGVRPRRGGAGPPGRAPPACAGTAAPPVAEHALQTTSPSVLDSEVDPHDGHRSRDAVQSLRPWQSGHTRTCSPSLTPRFQGLAPRTGSVRRVPHSTQATVVPSPGRPAP